VSLQRYLAPKPGHDLGTQSLELLVKLHDETSKAKPDDAVVSNILQDLDVLVFDYRREQTRSTNP
jgi:hypothetical protein